MPIPIDYSKLAPQDVLEIAALIEYEAQERYEVFADHLETSGDHAAASFFLRMAELEGAHGAQLTSRRVTRFSDLPSHIRDVVEWDVEGPSLERSMASLTVAQAIGMALASEVRARDFYGEALEHLTDPAVNAVLAELREDEIDHIRILEARRSEESRKSNVKS